MSFPTSATDAPAGPVQNDPPIFDAWLTLNRAMNKRAFWIFASLLITAAAAITIPLLRRGFWPILPFMGGDVAFLLIILHRHIANRARCQRIRVDRSGVSITQYDRHRTPVSIRSLPLYGLTLERDTDPDFGLRAVRLSLRGRAVEIARDLAPEAKAAFADDFERALNAAGCRLWRRDRELPGLLTA